MSSPFDSSITPKEAAAGFKIIKMDSGYGSPLFGTPEMWDVAAKKFTESDYLFKISEGRYRQMRYGYKLSSQTRKPEWHPVEEGNDFECDPEATQKIALYDTDFKIIKGIAFKSMTPEEAAQRDKAAEITWDEAIKQTQEKKKAQKDKKPRKK